MQILHINCRSLNSYFDSLSRLLGTAYGVLTAVAITETWLNDNSDVSAYQIHGYNFIYKRRTGKLGGGVGLYINKELTFVCRDDLTCIEEFIECMFAEVVQQNGPNIVIGCVYRLPNSDVVQFNLAMIKIIDIVGACPSKLFFIVGDINFDLLKYDYHAPSAEFFSNMMSHSFNNLQRYIQSPSSGL